jgi:hypothetical protein
MRQHGRVFWIDPGRFFIGTTWWRSAHRCRLAAHVQNAQPDRWLSLHSPLVTGLDAVQDGRLVASGERRESIMWSDNGRFALRAGRLGIALSVLSWTTIAYADDEAVIVAGKAAVGAKLIDPDSARFMDVRVITRNGRQFVCGHVAAKTRKGAYDAKPFVFIPNEKRAQHSAIIYGGRSITDDRFSNFAQLTAFDNICGS